MIPGKTIRKIGSGLNGLIARWATHIAITTATIALTAMSPLMLAGSELITLKYNFRPRKNLHLLVKQSS